MTLIVIISVLELAQLFAQPIDPVKEASVKKFVAVLGNRGADGDKLEDTQRAIHALVRIGRPAVPQLINAAASDHPTAGPYAILALDKIGLPALPAVVQQWEELNTVQRWRLMRFRGKYDYRESLPFAMESIHSRVPRIAIQALQYLAEHRERTAVPGIENVFQVSPTLVRLEGIDALGLIGGEEAVDLLLSLLEPDSWVARGEGMPFSDGASNPWRPDGRARVVAAIGRLKPAKATMPLLRLLRERGPGRGYMGSVIIPVLADIGDARSVPELRRIVAYSGPFARELVDAAGLKALAADAIRKLEPDRSNKR